MIEDSEHVESRERPFVSAVASRPKIVAIDGPAGSGKSSISSILSSKLGWHYVNTGAIYRAIGLLAVERGLDPQDQDAVVQHVDAWANTLSWDGIHGILLYGERDLTPELSGEIAGRGASHIAKLPRVREKLLGIQRRWALEARHGAILDGRDIGTVVFPDADLKIFLTASLEVRAMRRFAESSHDPLSGGHSEKLAEIREEISKRDQRDSARAISPLSRAADAVEVDTSQSTIDEVVTVIINLIKKRGLVPR